MKTVMKKLFSLMLVAVLLVSAFPMAASADGSVAASDVYVYEEGKDKGSPTPTVIDSSNNTGNKLLAASSAPSGATVARVWYQAEAGKSGNTVDGSAEIPAGSVIVKVVYTVPSSGGNEGGGNEGGGNEGGGNGGGNEGGGNNNGGTPAAKKPVMVTFCTEDSANVWGPNEWNLSGDETDAATLLYYAQKNEGLAKDYIFGQNKDGASVWRKADGASKGEYISTTTKIVPGDTVRIVVQKKVSDGGNNNGGGDNGGGNGGGNNNGGANDYYGDEAMKDIWLYIYTNTNMTTPSKRVLLNDYTIVSDGVVDKDQILSVIDDYYRASDSNKGIIWKGMYKSSASDVATNLTFVQGQLYDELSGLKEDRYRDVTIIMARVTGVTSRSSSATPDSSNPKTGDMIFAPMIVLGASASALAALFFLNKKRAL